MTLESAYQRIGQIMGQTQAVRPQVESVAPARLSSATGARFDAQLAQAMRQQPASATMPGMGQLPAPMLPATTAPGLPPVAGMPGSSGPAAQYMQFALQQASAASPYGPAPMTAPAAPVQTPMLSGDTQGLNPQLAQALSSLAGQLGKPIDVVSGFRSRAEQEKLYQAYLNGTGNLAAPPGSSNHESGNAADVYIDGVALANVPGAADAARQFGLHFPVGGEAWHVELMHR